MGAKDNGESITCAGCWYAKKIVTPDRLGADTLLCLRFPPAMVSHGHAVGSMFPVTAADAVCGEHQNKDGSRTRKPWEMSGS